MRNPKTLRLIASQRDFEDAIAIASLPRAEFRAAMKELPRTPKRPTRKAIGFGKGAA